MHRRYPWLLIDSPIRERSSVSVLKESGSGGRKPRIITSLPPVLESGKNSTALPSRHLMVGGAKVVKMEDQADQTSLYSMEIDSVGLAGKSFKRISEENTLYGTNANFGSFLSPREAKIPLHESIKRQSNELRHFIKYSGIRMITNKYDSKEGIDSLPLRNIGIKTRAARVAKVLATPKQSVSYISSLYSHPLTKR